MENKKETTKLEAYSNTAELEFQKLLEEIRKITKSETLENLAFHIKDKLKTRELTLKDAQRVQSLLKSYKLHTGHLIKSEVIEKEQDRLYYLFEGINIALSKVGVSTYTLNEL